LIAKVEKEERPEIPAHYSEELKNFINQLFTLKPEERPSA
jgi:hypothetical protein